MIQAIFWFVNLLISIYAGIMLVYCLLSWFIRDPENPLMRALSVVAEPPLKPIKRFLSRFYYFQNSPVDFSPLILFFILRLVVSLLAYLSGKLS